MNRDDLVPRHWVSAPEYKARTNMAQQCRLCLSALRAVFVFLQLSIAGHTNIQFLICMWRRLVDTHMSVHVCLEHGLILTPSLLVLR